MHVAIFSVELVHIHHRSVLAVFDATIANLPCIVEAPMLLERCNIALRPCTSWTTHPAMVRFVCSLGPRVSMATPAPTEAVPSYAHELHISMPPHFTSRC